MSYIDALVSLFDLTMHWSEGPSLTTSVRPFAASSITGLPSELHTIYIDQSQVNRIADAVLSCGARSKIEAFVVLVIPPLCSEPALCRSFQSFHRSISIAQRTSYPFADIAIHFVLVYFSASHVGLDKKSSAAFALHSSASNCTTTLLGVLVLLIDLIAPC